MVEQADGPVILVIKSSANGERSVSNLLLDEAAARLTASTPGARIIERDLDRDPVPHVRSETLAGIGRAAPATAGAEITRTLSDTLIAELKSASLVLIGAPMYNFGIPSTLKSWFDHVLRAGETFYYDAEGPHGLAGGRPVIVVETSSGVYSGGPMTAMDAQEPHLRSMLGFIGLDDVTFVRAEGLAFGEAAVAAAMDGARAKLVAVAMPSPAMA